MVLPAKVAIVAAPDTFKTCVLLVIALLSSIATAQNPGQVLAPAQTFGGELLKVRSPNSDGWVLAGEGANGIAFARPGPRRGESFGAQAVIFEMPVTHTTEELMDFVRNRIAKLNPAPRFDEIEADLTLSDRRDYPCVGARTRHYDNEALTHKGHQKLYLQVIALYCRHPIKNQLGFLAAYSYRGKSGETDIESEAKNFIASVTVGK